MIDKKISYCLFHKYKITKMKIILCLTYKYKKCFCKKIKMEIYFPLHILVIKANGLWLQHPLSKSKMGKPQP